MGSYFMYLYFYMNSLSIFKPVRDLFKEIEDLGPLKCVFSYFDDQSKACKEDVCKKADQSGVTDIFSNISIQLPSRMSGKGRSEPIGQYSRSLEKSQRASGRVNDVSNAR